MEPAVQTCLHIRSETDREIFLPVHFEILTASGWLNVLKLQDRVTYACIVGAYEDIRTITETKRMGDREITLVVTEYWRPGESTPQPRIYTEICGRDIERRRGCVEVIEGINLPIVFQSAVTLDGYVVRAPPAD